MTFNIFLLLFLHVWVSDYHTVYHYFKQCYLFSKVELHKIDLGLELGWNFKEVEKYLQHKFFHCFYYVFVQSGFLSIDYLTLIMSGKHWSCWDSGVPKLLPKLNLWMQTSTPISIVCTFFSSLVNGKIVFIPKNSLKIIFSYNSASLWFVTYFI